MSETTMRLESIQTGRSIRPRRTLVYGTHGVGKSTFGSMAPSPIFLPTEDGLDDIDCARFPLLTTWPDVEGAIDALMGSHDYQTVVTDSLDWLEKLIHAQVCIDKNVASIEDIGYQAGYKLAVEYWRAFLRGMDALRARGMGVIFLAHAKIDRFENPDTEAYDRYSPALHKNASPVIQEWCDEVFFAAHKVATKKTGDKFGVAKYKGISTGERVLRTVERPTHLAKRRLVLPDEIELDYGVYAAHVADALKHVDANVESTKTAKPKRS